MALSPGEIHYQLNHIHDDRSKGIVISNAVVLPLAFIAVTARFISRRLCKARIEIDDYMIIAALVRFMLPRGSSRNATFSVRRLADALIRM